MRNHDTPRCDLIARDQARLVQLHPMLGIAVALGLLAAACGGQPAATQPAGPPEAASAGQAAGAAQTARAPAAAELTWPGGRQADVPILGSILNAPPRATAVPLAAGAAPPPPPVPPAPRAVPIYYYVDTVTAGAGESEFNVDANISCVKTSSFTRGMRIVWRMEMVDTATQQVLQGNDVSSVVLRLPHGEEKTFRYGRHGADEDSPWFWTATFDVPMAYPLGVLDYRINVTTKSGVSATLSDPLVVSNPARAMDTRVTIVPGVGV